MAGGFFSTTAALGWAGAAAGFAGAAVAAVGGGGAATARTRSVVTSAGGSGVPIGTGGAAATRPNDSSVGGIEGRVPDTSCGPASAAGAAGPGFFRGSAGRVSAFAVAIGFFASAFAGVVPALAFFGAAAAGASFAGAGTAAVAGTDVPQPSRGFLVVSQADACVPCGAPSATAWRASQTIQVIVNSIQGPGSGMAVA